MDGVLLIDKPRGWTSHDVVAWVRKRLGTRQVGHGGTLDPAAEGLLIVAVGSATRLLQFAIDAEKSYLAHIVLGVTTTTDDLEGEPLTVPGPPPGRRPTADDVRAALTRFIGPLEQRPPSYAATKIGGVAAYRRMRAGESVALAPRRVQVFRLELIAYEYPDLLVMIDCSKGFYVRAFARDLGLQLGTGAYLHGLVRVRVGSFRLDEAWTLDTLKHALSPSTFPLLGIHPDSLVAHLPVAYVPEASKGAWYHGAPVPSTVAAPPETLARIYTPTGEWLGLGRFDTVRHAWQPVLVYQRKC